LSIAFQYKGLLVAYVAGATLSRHCHFFMLVHLAATVGQAGQQNNLRVIHQAPAGRHQAETGMPISKSNQVT
jgi:hypothetical protein